MTMRHLPIECLWHWDMSEIFLNFFDVFLFFDLMKRICLWEKMKLNSFFIWFFSHFLYDFFLILDLELSELYVRGKEEEKEEKDEREEKRRERREKWREGREEKRRDLLFFWIRELIFPSFVWVWDIYQQKQEVNDEDNNIPLSIKHLYSNHIYSIQFLKRSFWFLLFASLSFSPVHMTCPPSRLSLSLYCFLLFFLPCFFFLSSFSLSLLFGWIKYL